MKAVILAAGFGTRMNALGYNGPKALLEVGGRAALDWILSALFALEGVEAVDLISNAKFYTHFEQWRRCRDLPLPLTILNDGAESNETRRGAVGDFLWYLDRQTSQPREILLLASDNLWTMDLNVPIQGFRKQGVSGCLLREVPAEDLHRRGVAVTGEGGRLVELLEKPEEPPTCWTVPPLYYLTSDALACVRKYPASRLPTDAIGYLLAWLCQQIPINTRQVQGDWLDIGDPAVYQSLARGFRPFDPEEPGAAEETAT